MFLLNALAVNGVIQWPIVRQYAESKKINEPSIREVTVKPRQGKREEVLYADKVVQYPSGALGYLGVLTRLGFQKSKLELMLQDKVAQLDWDGEKEPPCFDMATLRKTVFLNDDSTIKILYLHQRGNDGGSVRKQGRKIFITNEDDGPRLANQIEQYSLEEADLFLESYYLRILEQIEVPKEDAV